MPPLPVLSPRLRHRRKVQVGRRPRARFPLPLPAAVLGFLCGLAPALPALEIGERVEANRTMNVRNAPAGSGLGTRAAGDPGTILEGPVTAMLSGVSYVWWRVDWDEGVDGWSFQDGLDSLGAPPPVVYGIDVSHWQGAINWNAVAADGKAFAFCKATEGVSTTDAWFETNMNFGRAAGLRMGAYHFARPNSNAALDEARFFVRTIQPYLLRGNLRPVLDLESGDALGKENLTLWAVEWCQEVERLTALSPLVYMSRNYARNFIGPGLSTRPLWIAEPEAPPAAFTSGLGPWAQWTFKQYSWTGRVQGIGNGQADVDLDSFLGGLEDLDTAHGITELTCTFTAASVTQSKAAPGAVLSVNTTIQSPLPRWLLLGAEFFPGGTNTGAIRDAGGDPPILLSAGGSAEYTRSFTLPADMPEGVFDLRLGLYVDFNNNGQLDAEDIRLGDSYTKSAALTVSPPGGFAHWAATQGLSGAEASPLADPDRDGSMNLWEYAFGTLPQSSASHSSITLSALTETAPGSGARLLAFRFPRAAQRPDLQWTVEISRDLQTWSPLDSATGDASFPGPGWSISAEDPPRMNLKVEAPAEGPVFLRLQLRLPQD